MCKNLLIPMVEKVGPKFKGIRKGETIKFYQKNFTIHVELDTLRKRGLKKALQICAAKDNSI